MQESQFKKRRHLVAFYQMIKKTKKKHENSRLLVKNERNEKLSEQNFEVIVS